MDPRMQQQNIAVTNYARARRIKRRFDAVLTIEDPGIRNGLRFHKRPHPDQLVLKFEDIDRVEPNIALPHMEHVIAAVAFGREHSQSSMLIHCKAGTARSTALALSIIADRYGEGHETEAVRELLRIRPEAIPNLILLDLADHYLQREGKLTSAWMAVEKSSFQYAVHRHDKREIFVRQPHLFSRPFHSVTASASRFFPNSLARASAIAATESEETTKSLKLG